jgi:hypothetical protein
VGRTEEAASGDGRLFCPEHVTSNKALMRLLLVKGILSEDELMAKIERLDREMKEKGESNYFKMNSMGLTDTQF